MSRKKDVLVYVYLDQPWVEDTGDKVRIMNIVRMLENISEVELVVLSRHDYKAPAKTIIMPRIFYRLINRIFHGRFDYDLSPTVKATNYIDELHAAIKMLAINHRPVYIFGSMTLIPFFLKSLGWKGKIIYDPFSNYAQTLYITKHSLINSLKLGLYLALHKLSLRSSSIIVYPSNIDANNAKHMFDLRNKSVIVIPNPPPFCYKSLNEYVKLRHEGRKEDEKRVRFILLAGSRGTINEKAVDLTLQVFHNLSGNYEVHITGPWLDKKSYANDKIIIHGYVTLSKLKELVASSDYGLAPIFNHAAGTFLKTITYLVGGLGVIGTPQSIAGIDKWLLARSQKVMIIRNIDEYRKAVETAVKREPLRDSRPITCGEIQAMFKELVYKLESILLT